MDERLPKRLSEYRTNNKIRNKGALCVVLYVTRVARENGLPLDAHELRTAKLGQVLGLSKTSVQAVLSDYGIERILAKEGGRTSRGSLGLMENYVAFLNSLHTEGLAKLEAIEAWWVERVRDYFAAKPFKLRYDTSKSLRAIVRNLLDQARERQAENPGTMYLGTVLQHLVGAKLELVFPEMDLAHHGASVADEPTARAGDFVINDVAIHVTSAPGELLIDKCAQNLSSGTTPLIVTLKERAVVAEALAEMRGIGERVEIFDAEQFLATNLHELSRFSVSQRRITIDKLVQKYNQIVDACETDPSLRIQS